MNDGTKIIGLEIDNIKRLRAVRVTPSGAIVTVSGRNAQGKSSLLDSIEMVLGGTSTVPREPIRRGSKKARIVCTLDNGLVIKRTFTENGSSLTVEDGAGTRFPSPQAMLDAMVGKLTFDPLAFTRLKATAQVDTLRSIVGLDFTALDARRKAAFDSRTNVNREASRLESQLRSMPPVHPDAPATPTSVADLTAMLRKTRAENEEAGKRWNAARDGRKTAEDLIVSKEKDLVRVNEIIAEIEANLKSRRQEAAELCQWITGGKERLAANPPPPDKPPLQDTNALQDEIISAQEKNQKLQDNANRAAISKSLRSESETADRLTAEIERCDDEKRVLLERAKFPIDGMAFDDSGVTLNGLPFDQASSAEQLRASVAIGLANNPKLRVMLLRDGSLLDEEGMELLAMIATENDAQLWVERVASDGAMGIVIEDGEIFEHAPSETEQALLPMT